MKNQTFEEAKKEIVEQCKLKYACEREFKRLLESENYSELNQVLRDNINWTLNNSILTKNYINYHFAALGVNIINDGDIINEVRDDIYILLEGKATIGTQSGGYAWSCETSTLTINTQSGGYASSFETSTLTIGTQSGGYSWSFGNSTLTIKN